MRKTMAGLLLAVLTSGCDVSVAARAVSPERLSSTSIKGTASKVRKLPAKSESKPAAATPETTSPAAPAQDTSASGEAAPAETPTASPATGAATTPSVLRLVKADGDSCGLIPKIEKDGRIQTVLFKNDKHAVTWKVTATKGTAPVKVARLKITFTPTAWYPIPEEFLPPDLFASEELPASMEAQPIEKPGPSDSEIAPTAIGWPTALEPDTEKELPYSLATPAMLAFLNKHPGLSAFTVTITPLDSTGAPLKNEFDRPFVLTSTVQVL